MGRKDFLLHGTYLYKTLQILTYVFDWLYFTQFLTSFLFLCTVFDSNSSNIDEVLWINPSANVFISKKTLISILEMPYWQNFVLGDFFIVRVRQNKALLYVWHIYLYGNVNSSYHCLTENDD